MADIGDVVVFTAIVTNTGNADAEGVVLTDVIPSFFDVTSVVVAPAGPTISIAGNTVSVAMGTVTPSDIYTVTIDTIVNSSATPPGATNTVNVTSSSPDADPNNNSDSATISISVNGLPIPDTGFAPGIRADLPEQPASVEYRVYESLELEIPTLDVRIPIVGVPATGSGWDVTWLDQQAGYLIGTAFPTWPGNSVITGHATLPGDRPGPFFGVRSLRFGDTVIIHAWGQSYAYEIRDVQYLDPSNSSVFQHEELPWVTLITCYGLDETGSEYRWRVAARGVLTAIGEDMRQDHFVSSPDLQRWKYIDGER